MTVVEFSLGQYALIGLANVVLEDEDGEPLVIDNRTVAILRAEATQLSFGMPVRVIDLGTGQEIWGKAE